MNDKLEAILKVLPQTQCGLCNHKGCRPYAQAMLTNKDTIDKCHPGGTKTLIALSEILNKPYEQYAEQVAARETNNSVVYIDSQACIGCTKCIQACPVDAIVGAAKTNHIVLKTECTGCDLCIPACPVDCIHKDQHSNGDNLGQYFRERYEQRQLRLNKDAEQKKVIHKKNKALVSARLKQIIKQDKN